MNSTRTRVWLAALTILASVGLLVGCPRKSPEDEPVKIGAIFSVTGDASFQGNPQKKTVEMLAEQVNAEVGVLGGRPLEVITEDDGSTPDGAAKAARHLIEQGVVAIIGPSTTPATIPLKKICQEAGVPLIACAAGKTITAPVASYVFAVPPTTKLAVARCFEYLEKEGIDTVASIYAANPFGEDGQNNIEAIAAAKGVEIVATETFGEKDSNMTMQLNKIKAAKPGALLCWGTDPGPALITKQARTIGLDVPILQSPGVANMKFIELSGEAANGVQLPAGRLIVWEQLADDDPFKSLLEDFATAYEAKYGEAPSTFAGYAYDAFWITVNAIEMASEADRAQVRDAIEQTDLIGTAGEFKYSADDHNGLTLAAFVWVKIVDGAWQLVE